MMPKVQTEEYQLLRSDAVEAGRSLPFVLQEHVPLSSGLKSKVSKQQVCCHQIIAQRLPYYIMPHLRRRYSSQ